MRHMRQKVRKSKCNAISFRFGAAKRRQRQRQRRREEDKDLCSFLMRNLSFFVLFFFVFFCTKPVWIAHLGRAINPQSVLLSGLLRHFKGAR